MTDRQNAESGTAQNGQTPPDNVICQMLSSMDAAPLGSSHLMDKHIEEIISIKESLITPIIVK